MIKKLKNVALIAFTVNFLACNTDSANKKSENDSLQTSVKKADTAKQSEEFNKNSFKDAKLDEEAKKLAQKHNLFAMNLYKQMMAKDSNVFFSPTSVYSILGVNLLASQEKTKAELEKLLYIQSDANTAKNFYNLFGHLYQINQDTAYKFNIANAIWVNKDISLKTEFADLIKKNFEFQIKKDDFSDPKLVKIINEWVNKNTRGTIPSIINELSPDTKLAMLNAIYMKAPWAEAFNENQTQEKTFYLKGKDTTKAMFMHKYEAELSYTEDALWQVVELPYQNNRISMFIALPKAKNQIKNIQNQINIAKIETWEKAMKSELTNLSMPKFTIKTEAINISDFLKKMGLKEAFSGTANFKLMFDNNTSMPLGEILHKAFINVNEKETEASAVTIELKTEEAREIPIPKEFQANHPFVFWIKEKESGMILFMGRLDNPSLQK
jgi:serpin B